MKSVNLAMALSDKIFQHLKKPPAKACGINRTSGNCSFLTEPPPTKVEGFSGLERLRRTLESFPTEVGGFKPDFWKMNASGALLIFFIRLEDGGFKPKGGN